MKLLLENWNKFVNENTLDYNTQRVLNIANAFLEELGAGHIEAIYLIGSRASGEEKEDSDWDYLVVGDEFDAVEDEKGIWADRGEPFPGLDVDVAYAERHKSLDIIFSSVPPKADQASKLLYMRDVE